jgi:thioredoxin 1
MQTNVFKPASIIVLLCAAAQADIVQLNSGGYLRGEVTGLADTALQVRVANGIATNIAVDAVRGVDFDHGVVNARLETKTSGTITGKLWGIDKQKLNITEDANGETRRVPLDTIRHATFAYKAEAERPRPVSQKTPAKASATDSDIKVITHGDRVDIAQALVNGKVTIVDYYADWCGPCRALAPMLETLAHEDPDIAVRKVDIVNWTSPVARQYGLNSIPRVQIYDRTGKLTRTLIGFSEGNLRDAIATAKSSASR